MPARLLLLCLLLRSSWLTVGRRPSWRRRRSAASPGRTGSRGRAGRRGCWRSAAAASAGSIQPPRRLLHAWSGSSGVDAVVTALVLAASRRSVTVPSHDRTDPSATRSVRACGEKQRPARDRLDSCSAVIGVLGVLGPGTRQAHAGIQRLAPAMGHRRLCPLHEFREPATRRRMHHVRCRNGVWTGRYGHQRPTSLMTSARRPDTTAFGTAPTSGTSGTTAHIKRDLGAEASRCNAFVQAARRSSSARCVIRGANAASVLIRSTSLAIEHALSKLEANLLAVGSPRREMGRSWTPGRPCQPPREAARSLRCCQTAIR